MAIKTMQEVVPYAVNFSVVVVILAAVLRKPTRKFIYQRHERMKDAVESAAIAHRKAEDRVKAARQAMERVKQEEAALLQREASHSEAEKAIILEKTKQETQRLSLEADRLAQVEQEEASDRVKGQFLELVVKEAEESLRRGLKKDDHSALLKNAQKSIEVGV
jgi:F0F1-type ATP synthase membrane subunit b/b'